MSRFQLAMAAIAAGFMAAASFAQEAANAIHEVTIIEIIFQGGTIGAIIIGMSVIGGALVIEFFVSLKREKLVPTDMLVELEQLMDEEEYEQALDLCDAEPSPLTRVVGAALGKLQHGFAVMKEAADKSVENESVRLYQKISWLAMLGNTGPMCGLLGTVWGMILAFNKIAQLGTPDPAQLAEGIQTALVTTVLGLVVAIPTMAFFFYFRNRVVRAMSAVELIGHDLIERFRPHPV